MEEMTKEQALIRARTELGNARINRIPVPSLCEIHMTGSGRKLLHLYDEQGRYGKIGAIWMSGPLKGTLTKNQARAPLKLIKMRLADFKAHIELAKRAEREHNDSAKGREMRGAIVALYSVFEGNLSHILEDSQRKSKTRRLKEKKLSLGYLFDELPKVSQRDWGTFVSVPKLRTWKFRTMISHPVASPKTDPTDPTRIVSAVEINQMRITIKEIVSDSIKIERFVSCLWQALKGSTKRRRPLLARNLGS